MRTFLIASILWSLIFYVKGKYVDVPVLRYDADYVIEGVWMLAVPIGGVMYGGFTLLVLRCVNWCTAKLLVPKVPRNGLRRPLRKVV